MLSDSLRELGKKVQENKSKITSEEHTKMAFIAPFLSILGYDVFNPSEVIPEYTCDFGTKKGEKVDYCVVVNGSPAILVECKDCRNSLTRENIAQLYRYFSVSNAKLAVLTNGIKYMLFTDALEKNKMDSTPFYQFQIDALKDSDFEIISMLCKDTLAKAYNGSYASLLAKRHMFATEVDSWLETQSSALSRGFINYIKREVNTYGLPNEEIEHVVRSKLFKLFKGTDVDIENESAENSSKEDKVEKNAPLEATDIVEKAKQAKKEEKKSGIVNKEQKRKNNAVGKTGEFSLEDARDALTGGRLSYVIINSVRYDNLDRPIMLLNCIIDYAMDVLHYTVKSLVKLDDTQESLGYFLSKEEGDALTESKNWQKLAEHRGIYYSTVISSDKVIQIAKYLLKLLCISFDGVKLGVLSKVDAK